MLIIISFLPEIDHQSLKMSINRYYRKKHDLNQVYAGLGQLLHKEETRKLTMETFRIYCEDESKPGRLSNWNRLERLEQAYNGQKEDVTFYLFLQLRS